jgi:adenylosuccinate synthase
MVVGAQWGDEGKGRIVDYLATRADMVIRFQGGEGDNAGHTVVNDYGRFSLHLVPCGIFYPGVRNLLGPGAHPLCVGGARALADRGGLDGEGQDVSFRSGSIRQKAY